MFFGIDLTQIIEVLGYPGIFAIVLAESGMFFGVSLPGGSLLFTAGLLASQGFLNIYVLAAVVIVAAVLGDSIGYWFGSWVGPALWRRPDGRFFKKRYLEQTRMFFDEHGSRTILLARFVPVVRTFAPILAGVAQMDYRTFFLYNMLGALLWGGGFVLGGYLLGETVPGIEHYLEYVIIGIVIVTVIPLVLHMRKARKAEASKPAESLPRAVIFDLDDTLAESYTPPTDGVMTKLIRLAESTPVAIMTGASFERVERDIMRRIEAAHISRFYSFSDSAARCHLWDGGEWRELYNFAIAPDDRHRIVESIKEAVQATQIFEGEHDTSRILDRETSVAFTAFPTTATQHEKRAWDPDGAKRAKLADELRAKLPDFEILIGGKSTIDVTREGITKEYGVKWLAKELGVEAREMLFIGDGFYEGGNDAVVIPTGIRTQETSGPAETLEMIDELLEKFSK